MTVVVTWYRKKLDEVWCASDSRITSGLVVATDSGPKILPIPILTHESVDGGPPWKPCEQFTLGFAYAGSTLSAVSTHALGSACTQTLARNKPDTPPPTVRGVADLFRKVAEHYIRDISSRMVGSQVDLTLYLFYAHIFGFCRVSKQYKLFLLQPELSTNSFSMKLMELDLQMSSPGDGVQVYPLGSGAEKIVGIMEELTKAGKVTGPVPALYEMLKRNTAPDVGGYFQCGVANRSGFTLRPIINIGGSLDRHVTFLGFSISEAGDLDDHHIGYAAFRPDLF